MKDKRIFFNTVLEACASADKLKQKYQCAGVGVDPTADGHAVLILKGCKADVKEDDEHEADAIHH